jgi:hypothetical protein
MSKTKARVFGAFLKEGKLCFRLLDCSWIEFSGVTPKLASKIVDACSFKETGPRADKIVASSLMNRLRKDGDAEIDIKVKVDEFEGIA